MPPTWTLDELRAPSRDSPARSSRCRPCAGPGRAGALGLSGGRVGARRTTVLHRRAQPAHGVGRVLASFNFLRLAFLLSQEAPELFALGLVPRPCLSTRSAEGFRQTRGPAARARPLARVGRGRRVRRDVQQLRSINASAIHLLNGALFEITKNERDPASCTPPMRRRAPTPPTRPPSLQANSSAHSSKCGELLLGHRPLDPF